MSGAQASGCIAVIKIGGSVFTGRDAYVRAAAAIATRLAHAPEERLLVVVSAEHGETDALLATARDIAENPDPATVDLLWSTGEIRSAALLALALQSIGVRAIAANVHQTGLTSRPGDTTAGVRPLRLLALLANHDVVVATGFLAQGGGDAVISLGRGGSDLTAVLLAAGLGAARCELVKDVPGYFSADPHIDPEARHLPSLTYTEALAMADAGCELVQRQALESARRHALPIVVRALDGTTTTTLKP